MNRKLSAAAAAALTLVSITATASPATAANYRFGTDERLYAYAKTGLKHENKPISLCYKTSTYNVFAPVYTTDEQVLCIVESKLYWPVPTGERLKKLQAAGLMPQPLPNYTRPMFDYLMGYILWIAFAGFGAFSLGASMIKRMRSDNGEAESPTA